MKYLACLAFAVGIVLLGCEVTDIDEPSGQALSPLGDRESYNQSNPTEAMVTIQPPAKGEAYYGYAAANVTLIEYGDFRDFHSAWYFRDILPKIKDAYIDAGRIKIIHRYFPVDTKSGAYAVAEAAECANEQGGFWTFHDHIYSNYNSITANTAGAGGNDDTVAAELSIYIEAAKTIGLDTQRFSECVDSERYRRKILDGIASGIESGVSTPPTFFINKVKLVGVHPYETFKEIIDAELGIAPAKPSPEREDSKKKSLSAEVPSGGIGDECAYVRADGTIYSEPKVKWYKECEVGFCQSVQCDFISMSSIPSEGAMYNCIGSCQRNVKARKTSSNQYCVFVKLTRNPDPVSVAAARKANQDSCSTGESCIEAGDCEVTIRAADATLWGCDGFCQ
ncbi:MAG: thioredoxin domain-containing protein [Ignavibacteriales bacterium]|nr:thioredoxin domain-containing protein [Ignavibacteriales bacterium]